VHSHLAGLFDKILGRPAGTVDFDDVLIGESKYNDHRNRMGKKNPRKEAGKINRVKKGVDTNLLPIDFRFGAHPLSSPDCGFAEY